jgi:hypothetical protein
VARRVQRFFGMETAAVVAELELLIDHLRRELRGISDPEAAGLCETSAEVLGGLVKAFAAYEAKTARAWK